ncbi:hypothetical protein WG66_011646 [Moniliophthora roreri]|nr:hypothetical protein WG66_011646 [Moniliophthora roreri]
MKSGWLFDGHASFSEGFSDHLPYRRLIFDDPKCTHNSEFRDISFSLKEDECGLGRRIHIGHRKLFQPFSSISRTSESSTPFIDANSLSGAP